ncbi:Pterin-4-alpha-carbinolamine dehydratase 2 [Ceratocystis fimbriata CBS 114723]|uniref:4a-hydroxytetrahydrobiopterin dehydratase n=1 Tax=Ceratocystis fimbriata CBS 114723 TaxID=1035309 RepID=A0A2C5WX86_9PEZI|nr:Pterin-4-alpha-carbinolamine dehydratase 2 [Ceratocystis fimbriata CBS 114723]
MSIPTTLQPIFAEGQDAEGLRAQVRHLLEDGGGAGRWRLSADRSGVERGFKFKTFGKAWDFMTAVSLQCKLRNHHPEWSNVYNTVFIRWTTHAPRGLTGKDIELAKTCDMLAADFGEMASAEVEDKGTCALSDLATQAAQKAGTECCVPKTKK